MLNARCNKYLINYAGMMNILKKFIRDTCRGFSLEIRRYSPSASPTAQIVSSLKHFGIDLVIDVGANQGQFASEIRSGGFKSKIV